MNQNEEKWEWTLNAFFIWNDEWEWRKRMSDEKADETINIWKKRMFEASWSVCEHANICFTDSVLNIIWMNGYVAGSRIEDSKGSLNIKMIDSIKWKMHFG
jgi:hypothetical protein